MSINQLMTHISDDLEKYGVTLPKEKIIEFIRKDQERLIQQYPSSAVDKVNNKRYILPTLVRSSLQ